MLGRLMGEHILVRFDRREGLLALEADASMLEQVIMNLAVNARDAMPHGGELTISIDLTQADEARVQGRREVQRIQYGTGRPAQAGGRRHNLFAETLPDE